MGMFDHIICEHRLPDNFDPKGIDFQSKCLHNLLDTYIITSGAKLMQVITELDEDGYKEIDKKFIYIKHSGIITFYSNNVYAFGPKGFVTRNDEKPWSREYAAEFENGDLVSIVLKSNKSDLFKYNHITSKEFHQK